MNLTHKPIQLKGPRRLATTALSLILGACACTSALALRMQVAAPTTQTAAPPAQVILAVPHSATEAPASSFKVDIADASTPAPRVKILPPAKLAAQTPPDASTQVSSSVMAGNREAFVQPTYPPEAKAAGIEGSVLLHAIIAKNGKIESLQLISGPPELMRSALDAVKQWTYKPYLLNGNPVAVDTTITVTYSLQK
jgi:TonB family protein